MDGLRGDRHRPCQRWPILGYVLLRGSTEVVQNTSIAAMVGLLLLATVEDLIPEADAPRASRWMSSLAFTAGFIGLALASSYLYTS
jgi:ZIP family zinc transporter